MITSSTIYWLTRLTYFNNLLIFLIFLFAFICIICGVIAASNDPDLGAHGTKAATVVSIYFCIFSFISALGACFVPTTKEMAAIYIIPKIANNKDVGEIPANTAKLLNTKLTEWISDNLAETKK